jgi:predicted ABC-type ATPase
MPNRTPNVYVIGGPNGAGKSTTARLLLANLEVQEFINADTIARGLAAGEPAGQALAAGRILLERMREYTRRGLDFAFETTMASSRMGAWIRTFQARGYRVHALYLWLPSPELALERVRSRVRAGGHRAPPLPSRPEPIPAPHPRAGRQLGALRQRRPGRAAPRGLGRPRLEGRHPR